jgi:hypothetical protein
MHEKKGDKKGQKKVNDKWREYDDTYLRVDDADNLFPIL